MLKVKLETVKEIEIPGVDVALEIVDGQIRTVRIGQYVIEAAGDYTKTMRILAPAKPKMVKKFRADFEVAVNGEPHGKVLVGDFDSEFDAQDALRNVEGVDADRANGRVFKVEVEVED